MKLIELKEVRKNYLNKVFNLEIYDNEKLIITGSNGSGKSTLVKLIASYIKPDFGEVIYYKDKEIHYLEELAKLPLNMKVDEYIDTIMNLKNTKVNYLLFDLFKVPLNKYIYELSKGNKQKLSLLLTLSLNDGIIIMDEPLNGLDKETIKEFIEFLNCMNKVLIIVTHYREDYQGLESREIRL